MASRLSTQTLPQTRESFSRKLCQRVRLSSLLGQGKVANDDVTCCRLMYNGQPLTLNLTVDKFNRSSSGETDVDHLEEFAVPALPCHSLIDKIFRGVPVNTYFKHAAPDSGITLSAEEQASLSQYPGERYKLAKQQGIKQRESCWNLAGSCAFPMFHNEIIYSFDLEKLKCHYFHDYYRDALD
jgi:hypothetical protein